MGWDWVGASRGGGGGGGGMSLRPAQCDHFAEHQDDHNYVIIIM